MNNPTTNSAILYLSKLLSRSGVHASITIHPYDEVLECVIVESNHNEIDNVYVKRKTSFEQLIYEEDIIDESLVDGLMEEMKELEKMTRNKK